MVQVESATGPGEGDEGEVGVWIHLVVAGAVGGARHHHGSLTVGKDRLGGGVVGRFETGVVEGHRSSRSWVAVTASASLSTRVPSRTWIPSGRSTEVNPVMPHEVRMHQVLGAEHDQGLHAGILERLRGQFNTWWWARVTPASAETLLLIIKAGQVYAASGQP